MFYHPVLMHMLKYRIRNDRWKCQILNKSPLNRKKSFLRSLEVVFDLCEKGLMRIMEDGSRSTASEMLLWSF